MRKKLLTVLNLIVIQDLIYGKKLITLPVQIKNVIFNFVHIALKKPMIYLDFAFVNWNQRNFKTKKTIDYKTQKIKKNNYKKNMKL